MEYLISIITAIFNIFPSGILEAIGVIAVVYIAFKLLSRLIARIIVVIAIVVLLLMLKAGHFNGIIEAVTAYI